MDNEKKSDKFKNKKLMTSVFAIIMSVFLLSGCASIKDWVSVKKGELIGNSYTIYQYDNDGNPTLNITGSNISISPYEPKYNEDGDKEINSVLDITIDGSQIITVGNTLVFEEKGISKIATMEEIDDISSKSGLNFIPFDKMMNEFKNKLGKGRMIIVYSQLGKPIGVYEGDSVYATIPKDLPKMTRINIDGKSLYLHRVNYTITDKKLMN